MQYTRRRVEVLSLEGPTRLAAPPLNGLGHSKKALDMPLRKSPALTPALLAANRQNARQSTGPRSVAGKQRVRLNALKHGLRSRRFRETVANSAEEAARFDRTLALFRLGFPPAEPRAERLAERLTRMLWTRSKAENLRPAKPHRFEMTQSERALMVRVVEACEWWQGEWSGIPSQPTKPECAFESTDSDTSHPLLRIRPLDDPALRRRVGKRVAKAICDFLARLEMYRVYQQSQNVVSNQ